MKKLLFVLCLMTGSLVAQNANVTPLLTKDMPDVAGKEASMVIVSYPPGGSSAPHRHNSDLFVYMLEGNMVMQLKGGKEVTIGPGQTFYEGPEDIHVVSKNASATEPAKFLVFSVREKGTPSLIPVK
jgi:quercetin dioxygenase-like cupin family protein